MLTGDLKPYSALRDELSNFDGIVLRENRIVVPQSLRKKILKLAHETYQGVVKTKQFIRTCFFFLIDDAIETKVKNCQARIVDQPLKKYTPPRPTPLPRGPWVKGVLDLVVQLMENPF